MLIFINPFFRDEKKYPCRFCDRRFKNATHRRSHMVSVHRVGDKNKCMVCKKPFPTPSALRNHEVTHNKNLKKICDQCNKPFATNGALKRHKSNVHQQEREFPCQLCDKSFKQSSTLKRHELTHFGEKVKCPKCAVEFTRDDSLKKHKKLKGH